MIAPGAHGVWASLPIIFELLYLIKFIFHHYPPCHPFIYGGAEVKELKDDMTARIKPIFADEERRLHRLDFNCGSEVLKNVLWIDFARPCCAFA